MTQTVILNECEDYPKGDSRSHACMAMTEPKGRDVVPSSDILITLTGLG